MICIESEETPIFTFEEEVPIETIRKKVRRLRPPKRKRTKYDNPKFANRSLKRLVGLCRKAGKPEELCFAGDREDGFTIYFSVYPAREKAERWRIEIYPTEDSSIEPDGGWADWIDAGVKNLELIN